MTKQTINLLGGVVVAAILIAGVFLGVLPRLDQAGQSHRDRDQVVTQNQTQQTLITAYAEQRKQLPALQAEVAALKQQIADGPHLEQLIEIASDLPAGAVLRSITPEQTADGSAPPADSGSGFQTLPVTVVVDLNRAADAPGVLDKLRAGPRLLAIDHVTLAASSGGTKGGGGSTLTVHGQVFMTAATS